MEYDWFQNLYSMSRERELEIYLSVSKSDQITALENLLIITGDQQDINELDRILSL